MNSFVARRIRLITASTWIADAYDYGSSSAEVVPGPDSETEAHLMGLAEVAAVSKEREAYALAAVAGVASSFAMMGLDDRSEAAALAHKALTEAFAPVEPTR